MPSKRRESETESEFISRCMSEIKSEYPDNAQRYAVCKSYSDKSMSEFKKMDLFVLVPRKAESRGKYLTRCSAHSKIKSQFGSLKERLGFCMNSFNEYYKYWAKIEMAEVPEDTVLGACIAKNKSRGLTYQESYARCASKVVAKPTGGTNPVVMSDDLLVEPVMFSGPVSIDFDDTLSTEKGQEMALKMIDEGVDLHIITRRQEDDSEEVYKIAEEIDIPKENIHFTNGKLKWETIKKLGVIKHIDNNADELKAIEENIPEVEVIKFK